MQISQQIHALDKWLYHRGFREPIIRGILRRGLLISFISLGVGLLLLIKTKLVFWFAMGCFLSVWNFWALAKRIYQLLPRGWSTGTLIGLLLHTGFRLLLTGIFLYFFLILGKASPFALVAGLTIIVIQITIEGVASVIHKKNDVGDR